MIDGAGGDPPTRPLPAEQASSGTGLCSRCVNPMGPRMVRGVPVEACENCGTLLVSPAELEAIIANALGQQPGYMVPPYPPAAYGPATYAAPYPPQAYPYPGYDDRHHHGGHHGGHH